MELRERAPNKDGEGETNRSPARQTQDDDPRRLRIRCPKCKWRHDWKAHWGCELCGAIFDTFVTRAHCPDPTCGNQWKLTWCPRCHQPSPHEDWYVPEAGPKT